MDLSKLSAARLNAEIEKRRAAHSINLTAIIQAGFGDALGSEIRRMAREGDTLLSSVRTAQAYVKTADAENEAYAEQTERRRWHGSDKPIKRRDP